MTTSTSLSGRSLAPRPPTKGSFPLDHLGECKPLAELYTSCLREHDGTAAFCRAIARQYLECRMETGLMAQEELSALGISETSDPSTDAAKAAAEGSDGRRDTERKGFVAGMRTARRRKRGVSEERGE
jgi:cytochrome c oxidase assembly protein subunit 19